MKRIEKPIVEEYLPVEVELAAAVAMDGGTSDRVLPGVRVEEYVLPAGQEPWWMRRWPPGVGRSWGREVLRLGGTPPACRGVAVLGMKIQFRVQYSGGRLGLGCGLVAERSTFGTIMRRIFLQPFYFFIIYFHKNIELL
jgi:hypothetical protein